MNKIKTVLMAFILLAAVNLSAAGQDYEGFFYSPDSDEDMKVVQADKSFSRKGIQYGLTLSPVYIYDNADQYSLSTYLLNSKLWARAYLWNNCSVYARVKDSYLGIISADGIYEDIESDNVFDLDLGFITMSTDSGDLEFSAGRRFFSLGTGLALDGRGDGAEFIFNSSIFSVKLLGMYTGLMMKDNNPYGLSDKDLADGAKRVFGGAEASLFFYNQKFYIFGLAQYDFSDEDSAQKTRYDSQYFGSGISGVFAGSLAYYGEFIYETGKSYLDTPANEQADVRAYAVNSGLDWYIPVLLKPVLMLQYAFGSGDDDRDTYVRSNRSESGGGSDSGFIYFGTFSGGYAFRPQLGNMHVFRGGFALAPFSWAESRRLTKMTLMAKYACYMKDKNDSGVTSGDAMVAESFIGQGIDVSLRWQMFYDLSMYVNYGLFLPGDAYDSSVGSEQFAMAGINLSI